MRTDMTRLIRHWMNECAVTCSLSPIVNADPNMDTSTLIETFSIPNLWAFRESESEGYAFSKAPHQVDTILYRMCTRTFPEDGYDACDEAYILKIYRTIDAILHAASARHYDALILDAFGCGTQFHQHPWVVARCWRTMMTLPCWQGRFRKIYFVVPEDLYCMASGRAVHIDELAEYLSDYLPSHDAPYSNETTPVISVCSVFKHTFIE